MGHDAGALGRQARVSEGPGEGTPPPSFLADAMLGRLARWLRVLGLDTRYEPTIPDARLVTIANVEARVLLTRDRALLRDLRPLRAMEVTRDAPLAQVVEVVERLAIAPPRELFTRCLVCNAPLDAVPDEEHALVVPPAARGLPGPVRCCPACGRVYWHGSHARRMRASLERTLGEWLAGVR